MTDNFTSVTALARRKKEGVDYSISLTERDSRVAVVAPHGGSIEPHTSNMAKAIAGDDFSVYTFDSLDKQESAALHVTSIHFDEPRCLDLLSRADVTVTIHGSKGAAPAVFLSGRDEKLQARLKDAFNKAGIRAEVEGHPYQTGKLPENICNKNIRGAGVQIELSRGLRDDGALRKTAVRVIRESLKAFRP